MYIDTIINWLIANIAASMTAVWRVSGVTVKVTQVSGKPVYTVFGLVAKTRGIAFTPTNGATVEPGQYAIAVQRLDNIKTDAAKADRETGEPGEPRGFKVTAVLHNKTGDIRGVLHFTHNKLASLIDGGSG